MESCKIDIPGLSQTSASVMNDEDSRQPVHRRPGGLRSRVRKLDCVLADIQAQIEILYQERTYLRRVQEELAVMNAK
ncbi:MAG: hypothetical protein OEY77_14350 [Nitrospira sp.]|nr:hypothetical protein [Nitrospira sp.]